MEHCGSCDDGNRCFQHDAFSVRRIADLPKVQRLVVLLYTWIGRCSRLAFGCVRDCPRFIDVQPLGCHITGKRSPTLLKDLLSRLSSRRSRRSLAKSHTKFHRRLYSFFGRDIRCPRTVDTTRRGSISRHAVGKTQEGSLWALQSSGSSTPPLHKYLTSMCTYPQRHHQHSDGD